MSFLCVEVFRNVTTDERVKERMMVVKRKKEKEKRKRTDAKNHARLAELVPFPKMHFA